MQFSRQHELGVGSVAIGDHRSCACSLGAAFETVDLFMEPRQAAPGQRRLERCARWRHMPSNRGKFNQAICRTGHDEQAGGDGEIRPKKNLGPFRRPTIIKLCRKCRNTLRNQASFTSSAGAPKLSPKVTDLCRWRSMRRPVRTFD